ncbi:DJ-1 family glyoxalase III [Allofustis seminis]|uniref:DJ-1 family glyoxalase III n=1 Tax=Allofustis seminis TaxID=166939 RepID=UPI00036CBFB9|nr:DJ-1 family glyoxalase III [Allofustis seminis]
MKKVAVFLAHGTEESEAIIVIDLLRRAGIAVQTVSIEADAVIHSAHDILLKADQIITNFNAEGYDLLFIPGGAKGVARMYESAKLSQILSDFSAAGGRLGAVCAGPTVLGKLGLLEESQVTCYPGWEDRLGGAYYHNQSVVISDKAITGRSMGACIPLALTIIQELISKEKANEIKDAIVYPYAF